MNTAGIATKKRRAAPPISPYVFAFTVVSAMASVALLYNMPEIPLITLPNAEGFPKIEVQGCSLGSLICPWNR